MKHLVKAMLQEMFSSHSGELEKVGIHIMFAEESEECLTIKAYEIQERVFCNFDAMEILKAEIPVIRKIVQDECWYLGEKLNHAVESKDVESTVDEIVLRIGEKLRLDAKKQLKAERCVGDCEKCRWKPKT